MPMRSNESGEPKKTLRVLIVDDNRDGADALGLLVEALGHEVHVTYGGKQALNVATAFRPDLMLVDLLMPDMGGCEFTKNIRQITGFVKTKIVAVTGQKDNENKALAMRAGFDDFLVKPASLAEIQAVLDSVELVVEPVGPKLKPVSVRSNSIAELRLPMGEARRIRHERPSKSLTQSESEAAICDGIIRFQEEYLGWHSEQVYIHSINDLLVVRIRGVLTLAERQLSQSSLPERGRDLVKQSRKQLLELARPMLESLVHEAMGVKVISMHHDISTVSGEEIVIFTLAEQPRFQ
jgi:CheY-like chemotaxis protein/uncharacterized protein YbcI